MNRIRLDVVGTYVIAALAFALSYSNLVDLAVRAGYSPAMAWAWPLAVDGLAVVATSAVMRLREDRTYAWILLGASTTVSVAAGAAAHLLPEGPLPGWAGAAVAVIPPLCLLVAPHLAVQLRRDTAGGDVAQGGGVAVELAVAQPATPEPELTCGTVPDQARRTATQADALCDATSSDPSDAPESLEEKRRRALHLLATTDMKQRAVAREVGISEASVRRLIQKHGAAPTLVAVGG
ncbi:uncharacterized protein DUF2637 [Rhodococcus sp. AG1013]|uniref:DUF2637 domain-containing protein n=1 Tax=Rhodococcus sp. AG1013 TaxID=2183996 RepID=UPI000E0C6BE8|nr:DUF2637 domain-containing protein [Rhodococcus sp. AG1013]RDI13428.1 uncharacterized protein DUF2637 [Rhodococcus sp. AG1013]